MIRWVCPNCGSGTNAPERPRRNDVRRYCLTCSKATGLLVERTAPKLERRRETAALRQRERRRKAAERERSRYVVEAYDALGRLVEVDLLAETRRALREMGFRRPNEVDVGVHRRHSGRAHAYPFAWRIHYSIEPTSEGIQRPGYEWILETVYHEAAHIATGTDESDARRWHGESFQKVLSDALQRRWPWLRWGSVRTGGSYEKDRDVVEQMRNYVKNGGEL